jgi:hypothetical protein
VTFSKIPLLPSNELVKKLGNDSSAIPWKSSISLQQQKYFYKSNITIKYFQMTKYKFHKSWETKSLRQ